MTALFTDMFARRALVELVLVGALCGVIGVHVALRRLAFFTGTLGHAAFPGIVAADLTGTSLWLGATGSSLAMVAWVACARRRRGETSTPTAIALAVAFGLGTVLISTRPGFSKDLAAAMVGSPVTVTNADITITAVVGIIVVVVLAALHKELVLGSFDPAILEALGYPVRRLDAALYTLLALTIVTCVPSVGAILPVALIIGPSVAALRLTRRIVPAMVAGAAFGALSGAVGLGLSLTWNLATGATVCLVTGGLFALGMLTGRRRPRPRLVG